MEIICGGGSFYYQISIIDIDSNQVEGTIGPSGLSSLDTFTLSDIDNDGNLEIIKIFASIMERVIILVSGSWFGTKIGEKETNGGGER